jgi:hypothetical protein
MTAGSSDIALPHVKRAALLISRLSVPLRHSGTTMKRWPGVVAVGGRRRRRIPDRDAVQQIIATFGQTIGIGDLGHDEYGFCCLVIDQDMVINIELNEAAQRLLLYSVVGRPGGERFPLLLEANHLGQGTGGGSLGLPAQYWLCRAVARGAGGAVGRARLQRRQGTLHQPDRGLDQAAASGRVRAGGKHLCPAAVRGHPHLILTGASFHAPFDHRIVDLDHWPALGDLLVRHMD